MKIVKSIIFRNRILFLLLYLLPFSTNSQSLHINEDILIKTWDAEWITHPDASLTAYGIFYFRKIFELAKAPEEFIIHVSADNRYELYVNGSRVAMGPAWGDLLHWRFESIDIARHLVKGENVISAQVVNFGHMRAISQFSHKTAFILQGNSEKESILNTHPGNWEVIRNGAYSPNEITWETVPGYFATNPTEIFDASRHLWEWMNPENNYNWIKPEAIKVAHGTPRSYNHGFGDQSPWFLVPRNIPMLEEKVEHLQEIERVVNLKTDQDFLKGKKEIRVPENTRITLLVDNTTHTRGFPELYFSGGKGSEVKITYGEGLYDENDQKGNRNVVEGKRMWGYSDIIYPDGGLNRSFRPLWYRIFRYLELEIETKDDPLYLDSLRNIFTAYPYELKADFRTEDKIHNQLFEMGWRTLRNGTAEIFEDGPYYEQLMYGGDARIASLVSLYMSGDERMTRNIIDLFDNSRFSDGLTYSRYPSYLAQINPQYSLCWIQTIHDYMMYSSDTAFARQYLRGISGVLEWHEDKIDETGMLGVIPWLKHIEAKSRTPRHPERGHSAQQTLFYALTLDLTAEIFRFYGYEDNATTYRQLSAGLKEATYRLCWDERRQLLGDTPEKDVFTQHANVLGILTDAIPAHDQQEVMKKVLSDTTLVQAFLFFHFWIYQAMDKCGMGNEFLQNIKLWERLPGYGFTTIPEFDIESRSDCHPWGTHINYYFLTTVAGIKAKEFGFNNILIKPQIGNRQYVHAKVPHPEGIIELTIDLRKRWVYFAEVTLPENISATFEWKGRTFQLEPGHHKLKMD